MNTPKVSVILTTCNRCNILSRAIKSVLAQGYPNYDLHIVDDASEDNTQAVVVPFVAENNNVFYWRNPTCKGVSAVRNLGISKSEGQFLVFLDDDDSLTVNSISAKIVFFQKLSNKEQERMAFIHGGFEVHITDENRIAIVKQDFEGDIIKYAQKHLMIVHIGTCLFQRRCLEEIQGFDESLRSSVNDDLFLKLGTCGYLVYKMDVPLALLFKNKHKKSLVSSSKSRTENVEIFLRKWTPFFNQWYGHQGAKRFKTRYRTDVLGKLASQKFAAGSLIEAWHLTLHVVKQNALFPMEIARLLMYYFLYVGRLCVPKRLIDILRGGY
jgi:glycosyltransferase involved in cell wall biosynthesis